MPIGTKSKHGTKSFAIKCPLIGVQQGPCWPSLGVPKESIIFHTHLPLSSLSHPQRHTMRTAVLVREPVAQLTSWAYHQGYHNSSSDQFLASHYLSDTAEFFNTWNAAAIRDPDRHLFIKYEDMIEDLYVVTRKVIDHFYLKISENATSTAISLCSASAMREKIPSTEFATKPRIYPGQRPRLFSDAQISKIQRYLATKLSVDFGYGYRPV